MSKSDIEATRQVLADAQQRGPLATLGAYCRLSGPGWLQSAITLGGGSLGGALYLGVLAGSNMLWLQLVAIVIGVIMLSAIAYVTLSSRLRPYQAINDHINPVLGVGWVAGTILANMIWIMPQFALCFDTLESGVDWVGDTERSKQVVSLLIAVFATLIVAMSFNPGWMLRLFDLLLKLLVGVVVVCFVIVVVILFRQGLVDGWQISLSFIPNPWHWNTVSPDLQVLLAGMTTEARQYWESLVIADQRYSMVTVTATAVGLNMTFLLPYSMLARGWDRPFRGLARFDLITGMLIPYLIVTSCIVIAASHAFHAKADEALLSDDPQEIRSSLLYGKPLRGILAKRYAAVHELDFEEWEVELDQMDPEARDQLLTGFAAELSVEERQLATTLIRPNARQLAVSLAPLLGERYSTLVFGVGAFAMGFSTIIILMIINGLALAEIVGRFDSLLWRMVGAVAACLVGFLWWYAWAAEESRTWLILVASSFAAMLLPIAYIAFFALMNNRAVLGKDQPRGTRRWFWNILMGIGVLGAVAQAVASLTIQLQEPGRAEFVIGAGATFLLLALIGFSARRFATSPAPPEPPQKS